MPSQQLYLYIPKLQLFVSQYSAILGHVHDFTSIQKVLICVSSAMDVIYLLLKRAYKVQNFPQTIEMKQTRDDSQLEPRSFEVSLATQ